MKQKRLVTLLLVLLMLASLPLAVSADRPESMETLAKVYTLNITDMRGSIEAMPMSPAFWEYPVLRAGEEYIEGTMVLRNNSTYTASMSLNNIKLPYGEDAKLVYLDHLQLTVLEGERVIYNNTYAHVNDEEGGLHIAFDAMAPGEEHIYTIRLRCLYDYAGDPYADASHIAWLFGASATIAEDEQAQGLPLWITVTLLIFAVLIVLLVVLAIVWIVVLTKKKKETLDNDE